MSKTVGEARGALDHMASGGGGESSPEGLPLLGDEAAALGAIHAGLSAGYGYPGTPSTEILEYLIERSADEQGSPGEQGSSGGFIARWCTNEKTALEAALGTSMAGRRALVTMKHVGLNVAADPFINGALLGIKGGLVLAVADDPGMHSSQNEQDSRFYAAFALVPCLEPRSQQEAYDMAREAFDLSERFHVPVMLRLVTRLSHARSVVRLSPVRDLNPLAKAEDKSQWMLLPAYARRNYGALIEKQKEIARWAENHGVNKLELPEKEGSRYYMGVITSGIGGNYFEENLPDLIAANDGRAPAWLHIGAYPMPEEKIREIVRISDKVLILEEGQPFIEDRLRGIMTQHAAFAGKIFSYSGWTPYPAPLPRTGELDPDNVRAALGLPPRKSVLDTGGVAGDAAGKLELPPLPGRPPQLCQGCPHGDSYETIKKALETLPGGPAARIVASDIGCYSLGALPPYSVPESIVCMGASIGMARGAAEAGIPYALAVIGDSTFLHSGMTGLLDAVAGNVSLTVIILDNSIVAMTGCQDTMIPSGQLPPLIRGLGIDPAHLLELEAKRPLIGENAARLRAEIEYRGLSVVIFKRECLEALRKRQKKG